MKASMLLTVVISLSVVAAALAVPIVTHVPLAGKKMRLADSPHPQGRRNLVGLTDANVDLTGVDPTVTGATVSIGPVSGPATVLDLPASGWHMTGNAPRINFKYKSRTGPVRAARVIDGRSIRFTAKGEDAYALGGVPQGEVGVVVDFGSVRFCGSFGGLITRDDGQRFVARNAPAPASCPTFGATTTSTSSSSTTTTSTSTTTTTLSCAGAGGVSLLGACWFLADTTGNQSCDDVCGGAGLAYDTATRTVAGDQGTDANCIAVMDALGAPYSGAFMQAYSSLGMGCVVCNGHLCLLSRLRHVDTPTNSSDGGAGYFRRACACG